MLGGKSSAFSSTSSHHSESSSSESSSSDVLSSSNDSSSDQSSSSSSSSQVDDNRMEVVDPTMTYYVGETLAYVSRLSVTLYYNGKVSDISLQTKNYLYELYDLSGNELDAYSPFAKAGEYKYRLKANSSKADVYSNYIDIEVLDIPSAKLTTKTKLPENFNYDDLENSCLSNLSIPSTGDVNVLVIPVEISDYPFNQSAYGDDYLNKIDTLFNGNGVEDTGYWESISSYYNKVSGGALNINFTIADVYQCGYTSSQLIPSGVGAAFSLAAYAVEDYKDINGKASTAQFDNDKDGYIDGLWMVYSSPQYSTGAYGVAAELFWAFCSDLDYYAPNLASPNVHSFGWASIYFASECVEAPQVDAHTFIHETGHLLSLPDYYSYDVSFGPQGGLAMMDFNIGDQDAFSKMSLGWANPYYAEEDCVVTLRPNESSGDCLIIADNWNGTAFDEYLLLDLETPTGVNELDSSTSYSGWPLYYSTPGIRLYHVDARLGEFKYVSMSDGLPVSDSGIYPVLEEGNSDYYLSDKKVKEISSKGYVERMSTDTSIPYEERASGYTVINANSPSRVLIDEAKYTTNRLLTLVGADGKLCEINQCYGSNDMLFKEGDCWALNGRTLKVFNNADVGFNNGDDCTWSFSVLECNEQEAKILVRKLIK